MQNNVEVNQAPYALANLIHLNTMSQTTKTKASA